MCGITGWVDWESDLREEENTFRSMVETMSRRGPDAAGIWLSPHAAIGHRRLIVVDPEGGRQPMVRRLGGRTFVITYNGELYNTPDLRRELQARGHSFQGHSDTEVLLVSYIEWGIDCLQRLNGIYAFAIWEEASQRLFLARDRLGVKPLFYSLKGNAFIFGSEPKAILANPAFLPEIDAEGLAEIFALGPSRTPGHGVYRGMSEVRPGHYLVFDRHGVSLQRYWSLVSYPHLDDVDTTAAAVRDLLQDIVVKQLVADVPVCILLSGGLDSSAVTAFAAKDFYEAGLGPLHTYSIDYMGQESYFRPNDFEPNSDSEWAKLVSDFLGTLHHPILIDTPQLVEALRTSVLARDLPGYADIDSSLFLLCREVKKEATVALSGESADEIFGGYPWFFREDDLNSDTFPWLRGLKERMRVFSPDLIDMIKPEEYVRERYRQTLAEVPRLPGEDPLEARMREVFYLNINWFQTGLLDRKDRMSMATGLEVRVPFCDHRLVEYVWNIPWSIKTCDHKEKGILRRALAGLLPDGVLNRRKSPYPKTHNPAFLEGVRSRVQDILEDPNSPLLPMLNKAALQRVMNFSDITSGPPWYGQLMRNTQLLAYLWQVDIWLREYRVAIV